MALGLCAALMLGGCDGLDTKQLIYTGKDAQKITQAVSDDRAVSEEEKAAFLAAVKADSHGLYEGKKVGDIIADWKEKEAARETLRKELENAVELTVTGKEKLEADEDEWRFIPETVLTVRVTNRSGKDIRAFKGILHIGEKDGEDIAAVHYADKEEIAAGETKELTLSMDAHPMDETDTRIYNMPLSDMKIRWETDAVIYKDKTMAGDVSHLLVPGYTAGS